MDFWKLKLLRDKIGIGWLDRLILLLGVAAFAVFILTFAIVIKTGGLETRVFGIKFRVHSVNFALLITSISCLIWLNRNRLSQIDLKWAWFVAAGFALIISILKVLQFEHYVSTGYDLGIRANILYNIFAHSEVWDSLNWSHGFSGHFWPAAYPLSLLYHIWLNPKILLIAQTVALAAVPPIIAIILKRKGIDRTSGWLIIWLWCVNYYLHRMSAFDFHPEVLATPLFLLALHWLDTGKIGWAALMLAISLTLKEDVAVGIASIGLYLLIFDKRRKALGISMIILSGLYFVFAITEIYRHGRLLESVALNYGSDKVLSIKKIEVAIRYFATFGFLPLLMPKMLVMLTLPFAEHILNTWPMHYHLYGQYVALLLPVSIFITIEAVKRLGNKALPLILLGILTSSLAFPYKVYLPLKRVQGAKKRYLDRFVESIPPEMPLAAGNHITPHLALRRKIYQIPTLRDAQMVIVDTSWHDYTPMRRQEGERFIDSIIKSPDWQLVSDSFGVLVIQKIGREGFGTEGYR